MIDTAIYIIPYGLVTYLGFNYYKMSRKLKYTITIAVFMIFVITGSVYWCREGAPQLVQIAKYPPRLYYLSYGVFCSFVLLIICESKKISVIQNRFITWIATHSMWIYLWHILALLGYSTIGLPEIWYIKLIVVYALAMVAVVIVNKILDIVERNRKISCLKFLRG